MEERYWGKPTDNREWEGGAGGKQIDNGGWEGGTGGKQSQKGGRDGLGASTQTTEGERKRWGQAKTEGREVGGGKQYNMGNNGRREGG